MNIATSRFTISTIAVAVCAMVALVAAEPVQAQTQPSVQRIEIVGQRIPTLHRFVVVGQRAAAPSVQRIEIVGRRQPAEQVAVASRRAQKA
jgi:hypothetical protein